jgi:hypothetical protein
MSKKFLVGVGNVTAFNISTGDILFKSKTILDDSIDITTASEEISAGQGNALQYIYYHSGRFNAKLTETQFSLNMIGQNVGASILTGKNIWTEETVTLGAAGAGTVVGTPLLTPDVSGSDIYGYVTDADGTTTKVTFSGSDFTLVTGAENDIVCVQYFALDSAARYVTVNSNFLPSVVRLVIDTQLASSDESSAAGSSIIGKVQVEVPRFQISGSQSISMTASGVAQTPLEGMALSYAGTGGCAGSGHYATITEVVDTSNWYDNVTFLAIADDTIALTHPDTSTLVVWAVPSNGDSAFIAPVADLSFTSGTVGTCNVGLHTGIITTVAAGSSIITCVITNKNTVGTTATVTVS